MREFFQKTKGSDYMQLFENFLYLCKINHYTRINKNNTYDEFISKLKM
ncbi:hypothetical protein LEP1GSC059_3159 [Leptospira noguchii serovar Panama str. CZ214]|uniref:Uncharacterized protein n=1 Tax=Leptospira noguchii serovar Panama str. CZ214 TaxID=1001595 RepID=T0GQ98_9LEPT|nr:hypothetical protein LEP1GSC059_3159 [Leptospira noguchii serovar Panama str. CZ214]